MLTHYHGQIWNAAEPARAMGVSESTTRRYLDLLSDALMVRQLQPCPFLNWLEARPFSSDVARFGDALRRSAQGVADPAAEDRHHLLVQQALRHGGRQDMLCYLGGVLKDMAVKVLRDNELARGRIIVGDRVAPGGHMGMIIGSKAQGAVRAESAACLAGRTGH